MDDLLQILAGSATIGAVMVFLGRIIINKGFDAALKTFQNKLDLLKIEHQIKYSKLHEERASLLKDLYKELYELENKLAYLTSAFQGPEWTDDDTRRNEVVEQYRKCKDFLEINRIFFLEDFCTKLSDNLKECEEVINGMDKAKFKAKQQDNDAKYNRPYRFKAGETPLDIWFEQEKKVKTEIRGRRIELANCFREIIGVTEEKN